MNVKFHCNLKVKTLTTGMLAHVSQISTQRISIYVFCTIKASSGEYRHYPDIYIYIYRNSLCSFVKLTEHSRSKCYLQCYTSHHRLPPLNSWKLKALKNSNTNCWKLFFTFKLHICFIKVI